MPQLWPYVPLLIFVGNWIIEDMNVLCIPRKHMLLHSKESDWQRGPLSMRLPVEEWPVSQDITGVEKGSFLQLPVPLTTSMISDHP